MKVIVVGCTHAGTAAIVNMKTMYEDVDVTVYERNDNISFLSCGIALYVGGTVKDPAGLFYSSPEALKDLGATTHMQHEITSIDIENKKVNVKNLITGETFDDTYDKLVLTLGSWPIDPSFEGRDLENIVLCKNYNHANTIIAKAKEAKKVVVVGAGYIGVELAEAFQENGKEVVLVDAVDRILSKYLDPEYTDRAEQQFKDHGIKLALGEKVVSFEGEGGKVSKVNTDKGCYEADLVVMCIGFRPNTGLVKGQIDLADNGAVKVDRYMRTSNKDVLAAGDSCLVYSNPLDTWSYIPLATNAVRMGTLVAHNLKEEKVPYIGTQGTSGIKVYEECIASSGLTEEAAKAADIDYMTITATDANRPEFMPTYEEVSLKYVFDKKSHELLGAQIISKADVTQMVNALSIAIQKHTTVEELAFVDCFFQPHFNKPWNLINLAGQQAMAALK